MAYKNFDDLSLSPTSGNTGETLQINGPSVELPDASFVKDAALERQGADLVLDGPQGTLTVEGYFSSPETPDLVAPNGETLTPELVNSFARSPAEYAQNASMTDESPVGSVDEISGEATITRLDGSVEPISMGTEIFQGDVIETGADGAVNIAFIDETTFAVSEEARLAIDEYVYDPATESGAQDFSVLKGVFVFTSGLIGRDDPDDVNIDTPSGSIGIRGTIIAGNADTGEITVIEGAIVVRDLAGNEMTLANQFETAKFDVGGGEIQNMGQLPAQEVAQRFSGVSGVSPTLFSSINDAAAEQGTPENSQNNAPEAPQGPEGELQLDEAPLDPASREEFNADGSVDHNGDNAVDGTVEGGDEAAGEGEIAPKQMLDNNGEPVEMMGEPMLEPKPMMQPTQTGMMGMDPMGTMTSTAGMETLDGGMNTMDGMGDFLDPNNDGPMSDGSGDGPMDGMDMLNNMNDGDNAASDGSSPPPPSGDSTQDPNTIPPPPVDTTPPVHLRSQVINTSLDLNDVNIAPSGGALFNGANFFQVSEGQMFQYHFDLEFHDPQAPNSQLEFFLSSQTINDLNNSPFGGNWTFNATGPQAGKLTISDTGNSITSDSTISIDIRAADAAGNSTTWKTYNLEVLQPDYTFTSTTLTNTHSTKTIVVTGDNAINGASSANIFYGNGDDIVNLDAGNGNSIHLGEGHNDILIQTSNNNTVFGGNQHDTFMLKKGSNDLFGMDGDDVFKIDMTSSASGEIGNSTNVVDGGHSSFKAGDELRANGVASYQHAQGDTGGYGDTLYFEGTGASIDFASTYNQTYFRGIERIDLTSGHDYILNLTYQDVVDMTDHKNTLIIRADSGDTLNFSGFTVMQKTEDVSIEDDYATPGAATTNFDVYSDGTVTLLIEDTTVSPPTGL